MRLRECADDAREAAIIIEIAVYVLHAEFKIPGVVLHFFQGIIARDLDLVQADRPKASFRRQTEVNQILWGHADHVAAHGVNRT